MPWIDAVAAWAIILAGALAPAEAANWVEVGIATNGVRAMVDTDSIVAGTGVVEVRQRFVMPRPGTGRVAHVDQHVIYDCRAATVRPLNSREFDAAGRLLRQEGAREHPVYPVGDKTLPRYIFDVLC